MAKTQDTRIDPLTLAVLMTDPVDAPHDLGMARTWTPQDGAKRVRSIARDVIDRFINRTGYTAHAYTLAEAAQIVAEAREHGRGSGTVTADAIRTAAKSAAPKRTRKSAPKVAKVASVAPDASQDVPA